MRRTVAWLFSLAALIGLLAVGAHSISAQDMSMADHPLVGVWELAVDFDPSCHSNVTFTSDGAYIDVDCDGTVVIGAWEPTGENTATMNFTETDQEGTIRVRASIEVAADGQSFTAPFTIEAVDPSTGSGMGQYGPGMATGTRLTVEAPGTPIGSISELFGTPEATPAS